MEKWNRFRFSRFDFRRGRHAQAQTASGPTEVWLVRLDTLKVRDITMHGVDALVFEDDLLFALLKRRGADPDFPSSSRQERKDLIRQKQIGPDGLLPPICVE